MVLDLFRGAGYLGRGLRIIRQPGIRRYAVLPVAVSVTLFSGLILAAYYGFEWLMARFLPQGYEWLQWLLWPLFAISILLVMVYGFTLLANLVGAPFNGALSAAVERYSTGTAVQHASQGVIKDAATAVGTELQRIVYFLVRALPLLLLFVIPGINLIAPALWILFSAWMLSLEYASYPLENHGIAFESQRQTLRRRRLLMLGFGGAVLFTSMVPILNFFIMPAAVAGATLMYLDHYRGNITLNEH